jgi:hypothetical protein
MWPWKPKIRVLVLPEADRNPTVEPFYGTPDRLCTMSGTSYDRKRIEYLLEERRRLLDAHRKAVQLLTEDLKAMEAAAKDLTRRP